MSDFRVGQVVLLQSGNKGVVLSERSIELLDWSTVKLNPCVLVASPGRDVCWMRVEDLRPYDGP